MSERDLPESSRLGEARPAYERGIEHILVPLDGSRLAESVLPISVYFAERCDATITLLHVIEHRPPATVHGEPHLQRVDAAGAYLGTVAARYRDAGVRIDLHVHPNPADDVAMGIADHAVDLHADLIVLATHGLGGLRDVLFGQTAQRTVRKTATPVLLVRPVATAGQDPAPAFSCHTILVPLDGRETTDAALPFTRLLAVATGAAIHLVRVVATAATVSGDSAVAAVFLPTATAAVLEIEQDRAHDRLVEIAQHELAGLKVTAEVRRGDVADEIAQAAQESPADLLVMSTHGKSGLSGHLSASVGNQLLERIKPPLLLIRMGNDDSED